MQTYVDKVIYARTEQNMNIVGLVGYYVIKTKQTTLVLMVWDVILNVGNLENVYQYS